MLKFIAILSVAALFSTAGNAAEKGITARVNAQIDFATSKKMCYAPIVFEAGAKPAEVAAVKAAAEKRGWKLGHHEGRIVNVEDKACPRI